MTQATSRSIGRSLAIGALALMAPVFASAQAPTPREWQQGSALAVFGGVAAPHERTGGALGGSVAWELTPRFSLDAGALWLEGGHRTDAVFASIGARYLLTGDRPVAPYVTGGVGVYHAMFDDVGPGVPDFYRRRMPMNMHGGFATTRATFDDFAIRAGAGAEIFASRHLSFRPEVQVILVTDRPRSHVVPVFGLHAAYHFESHPITPSRGR